MTLGQLNDASMSLLRTRRTRLAEEGSVAYLAAQCSGKDLQSYLDALLGREAEVGGDGEGLVQAMGLQGKRKRRKRKAKEAP